MVRRALLALSLLVVSPFSFGEDAAPVKGKPEEALARYVARPEPVYGWALQEKAEAGGTTIYKLELTSQTWQGIVWKHVLHVYEPQPLRVKGHAILFVTGGSDLKQPSPEEQLFCVGLANLAGGRVAMLKQVPNQPLFGGRVEDDLITETWLQYLKTGDDSWPLLFPMVKSAVKAMDAVGELGKKEGWPEPVNKFVITGASKRGWTSWLTPVADTRVVATAPIVIDTLNFRAQMDDQLATWGKFSEQIDDYTRKGLIRTREEAETPRELALRTMMDPWTYRERLNLPKLMINGTNDRYWVVDASKNYFHELTGPKNVLEIPNAGHNLGDGRPKAAAAIAAHFRRAASGGSLPKVEWSWEEGAGGRTLALTSDPPAASASVWTATSETNDFREAKWSEKGVEGAGANGAFEAALPAVSQGQRQAAFGELRFVDKTIEPPVTYSLTTTVRTWLPGGER
jgi:PhoPQ-activated pathogenicity-related protein